MSVQNFSFLARLEEAENFVVVGWSRPSLRFSFSQAEQYFQYSSDDIIIIIIIYPFLLGMKSIFLHQP